MSNNRVFVRIQTGGRISTTGKIYADSRSPTIDCTVIDLSARGACLDVHGSAEIPKKFTFLHGGLKKNCRILWQKGRRVGIAF